MNIFGKIEEFIPATITSAALRIGTLANSIGALSVLGQIAQVVTVHQSLLNTIFGEQKGALVSLVCFAVGQAATNVAAHGAAIGGPLSDASGNPISPITNNISVASTNSVPQPKPVLVSGIPPADEPTIPIVPPPPTPESVKVVIEPLQQSQEKPT